MTSPGWDNAAPGVLEGLCRTLDWELAEYWEVDGPREAMHFVTSWKRPGRDTTAFEATAANQTYRRGEGLAGRVWEAGGPIAMPDLAGDPTPRSAAAVASGLHGIVGFPVRSGRRVVGMISLHTWAARGLDDGLVAVMNDVGSQIGEFVERKRAEVALQDSEKRMRSVLDNVSDGLATIDQAGIIDSGNPAVVKLFGYSEQELVGQQADILIATTHRSAFDNYLQRRLQLDIPVSGAHETMGKRKNGSLFPLEFVVSSMQVGARHLFIATLRDISERKAHTDALEYQALHDALTGLPNRSLFGDRLRQALLAARRNQKMFGVLLLDLDRFKDINDALGHDRGDSLLQEVTARLRGVLRATDTIARLGGDEFATSSAPRARSSPRSRARLPSPTRWSKRARRSGSPCIRSTATTPAHCCAARTWRCTSPSAQAAATRSISRSRRRRRCAVQGSPASCAARSRKVSWSSITSPRSPWRRARSTRSRRSSAGTTRGRA
ncbi:MAG: diguanylate cyclase [Chloroflexi bacterium]|nr:MAG: diguanylate cyclase [Chloroflexota bacterium]